MLHFIDSRERYCGSKIPYPQLNITTTIVLKICCTQLTVACANKKHVTALAADWYSRVL